MNPFDMEGHDFLGLFAFVAVLAVIAAAALRWCLRGPGTEPWGEVLDLEPYEVAYLAGGERLAVDAAILRLIHIGAIGIHANEGYLSQRDAALPTDLEPIEEAIFNTATGNVGANLDHVRRKAEPIARSLRKPLDDAGLLVPEDRVAGVRWWPTVILGAAATFGFIKIMVGISRHRPVGFLVLMVIAVVLLAIPFVVRKPYRSRRGDAALRKLRRASAALEFTSSRRRELAGDDLILAIGLFGTGVLAFGALASATRALQMAQAKMAGTSGSSSGWSGWWGSCGSGASCGGGGCGGGCGGGGCGGCGGG